MIHCSDVFKFSKYHISHAELTDIEKLANSLSFYHPDHIESGVIMDLLQKIMMELVKTKPGTKPDVPLRLQSEDGLPTWMMGAWAFEGFYIIEIGKHRHDSPRGNIETRLELIPFND